MKKQIYFLNLDPEKMDTAIGFNVDENGNAKDFEWKTLQQGVSTYLVAAFDPTLVGKFKCLSLG